MKAPLQLTAQDARPAPRKTKRRTHGYTEATLLRTVLKLLQLDRRVAWAHRINSGGGRVVDYKGKRLYIHGMPAGTPDILLLLQGGRYGWLECKQPGQYPNANQRAFIELVRASGGMADVVRSLEDVETVLSGRRVWPRAGR